MDEIEFHTAIRNLNTLTSLVQDANAQNALKVVSHLLVALNERIEELATAEDVDEC